jgi:hypothetical protein
MSSLCRVVILALLIASFAFQSGVTAEEPTFTRSFNQKFSNIAIENLSGTTSIQTWSSSRTMVQASRPNGDPEVESRLQFQITTPDALRIIVRETANPNPINLTVYVPRQANLSLRAATVLLLSTARPVPSLSRLKPAPSRSHFLKT